MGRLWIIFNTITGIRILVMSDKKKKTGRVLRLNGLRSVKKSFSKRDEKNGDSIRINIYTYNHRKI